MKNLRTTTTPEQTRAFVGQLWKTELFRNAHDAPDGWLRGIVDQMCERPKLWCELDDGPVERSHFLSWMGIIPLRDEYSNPAISDLYYLHEYIHLVTMTHAPDPDLERWQEKIWTNERDASLGSEVYVYFELEGLRPMTFEFEIWADRYLAQPEIVTMHRLRHPEFLEFMEAERERAMLSPAPGDENERLIASYHRLNIEWGGIWAARYLDVEATLAEFTERATQDPAAAIETLRRWALDRQGEGLCPFEREARAFADVIAAERARA